jgi:glycerophosphoryl diester phosphodiesterase
MSPKINQTVRLLDCTIGIIIKVTESHCTVQTGKNVKRVSRSTISPSFYEKYDYFQVHRLKKSSAPPQKRIPINTLIKNPSKKIAISKQTNNEAIKAFKKYAKILRNYANNTDKVNSHMQKIIEPFLKKGFGVKGYIQGRDRIIILFKEKDLKAYRLPMI